VYTASINPEHSREDEEWRRLRQHCDFDISPFPVCPLFSGWFTCAGQCVGGDREVEGGRERESSAAVAAFVVASALRASQLKRRDFCSGR
jgi:hypothetical protein